MGANIMDHLEMELGMDLGSTTSPMETSMKVCGRIIPDMEMAFTTTVMEKFTEEITIKGREMAMEFLTIRMETDMKASGNLEI